MRAVTLSGKMTVPEVHSDDGVIAWEDGEGLRLVLIHGMFGDYLDWEPVLATLAERYHVVAVDLPGFGNAGKPDADYSAGFFLERLHGALGSAPLVLAGNSFGGQIAMLYTLAYPEQVERLILVDTGGLVNFSDVQKQWLLSRFPEPVLRALTPEIHQTMFRPLFVNGSPRLDRYIAKHDAKLSRVDYPEYTRALMRSMRLSVNT